MEQWDAEREKFEADATARCPYLDNGGRGFEEQFLL